MQHDQTSETRSSPGECRAFTLIEFLISLVIIGFIIAILTNYFSGTVQESAEKSCATRILSEMGSLESGLSMLIVANNGNDLIDVVPPPLGVTPPEILQYVTAWPPPPVACKAATIDPLIIRYQYVYYANTAGGYDMNANGKHDSYLQIVGLSAAACQKYNDIINTGYAGLAIPDFMTSPANKNGCYALGNFTDGVGRYDVIRVTTLR